MSGGDCRLFGICVLQLSYPEALHLGSGRGVRKRGMNGKDSTGDRATRLLLPIMVRSIWGEYNNFVCIV